MIHITSKRRRQPSLLLLGMISSTLLLFLTTSSSAQEYDYQQSQQQQHQQPDYTDYADGMAPQDNLYADYAMKQAADGGGGGNGGIGGGGIAGGNGGPGMMKLMTIGGLGWIVGGTYHSNKATKHLKKKHMKEAHALYSQYYSDVHKLKTQNEELADAVQKLHTALQSMEDEREMESMQRDYEEFKQPDVDGDDRISRAEFAMYVKNYLSNYPGLTEKDYPKFEEFDHDGDGYVSFSEYSQQMALQSKKAQQEAVYAAQTGQRAQAQKAGVKAHAYAGLSGGGRADNFDDLYALYNTAAARY